MATSLLSLSKLFTERLFRIPDYQRGYAWGERQVSDFWNDLVNVENEKSHYAGVITLEEVLPEKWKTWTDDLWLIKSKGFTPYYVVDGQQRLTTAVILIQCFIESIGQVSEKLNFNSARELSKRYIYEASDSGVARSYIFCYEDENPSFNYLRQVIFREKQNPRDLEETAYTSNLAFAKDFFAKKIHALSDDTKHQLFRQLTQSILFNTYEIESEIDVFVAFETMNNRGKPLSHLELLKTRLIYLTTRLNTYSKSETSSLRSSINNCWRSLYHHLGRNKQKLLEDDRFLFTHSLLYFADFFLKGKEDDQDYLRVTRYARKDYQSKLLEEIFTQGNLCQKHDDQSKNLSLNYVVDISSIHKYVENLKDSVELWFDIFNPALSAYSEDEKVWLDRLNRINGMAAAPLILAFYEKEKNPGNRVVMLRTLERTIFLFQLWGPYGGLGDYFIHLALELIQSKTTVERVVKQVENAIPVHGRDGHLVGTIRNWTRRPGGFYEWPGIRYFLYEYEQFLRAKTKADRNKIAWDDLIDPPADHVTVEHIYPQIAKDPYWVARFGNFSAREKTALRNSLGNLLPLSRPKNSSLQNKSFDLKKSEKDKFVGFLYGSLSENEVATLDSWDAQAILERGLKLLAFAKLRWSIELGDVSKQYHALGLEFLNRPAPKAKKKVA